MVCEDKIMPYFSDVMQSLNEAALKSLTKGADEEEAESYSKLRSDLLACFLSLVQGLVQDGQGVGNPRVESAVLSMFNYVQCLVNT